MMKTYLAWVVLCVLYGHDKGVGIGWSGGTVCKSCQAAYALTGMYLEWLECICIML